MAMDKTKLTGYSICALLLLVMPFIFPVFWVRVITGVFMWIGLALSWNMIGGHMGYVSFGHGAFFGVGAYITGLLMSIQGLPFFPSMVISGVFTCVFAALVGVVTLRLNGTYFAIGTWAFAEMMRQLVLVLPFTGGSYGLRLPPEVNEMLFYYLMLILAVVVTASSYILFDKSSFGLKVRAIREEETAAQMLGIDTVLVKVYVFAVSALFPGIIGAAYAYWMTFIHPDSVLGPLVADQMVVMVLLGGIGTLFGPVLGAAVMYIGNRIIWVAWGDSSGYLIILGLAICLIIRFLPEGIINLRFLGRMRTFSAAAGRLTAREEAPK
jgi:branched-chain amino acid transport system permease protein